MRHEWVHFDHECEIDVSAVRSASAKNWQGKARAWAPELSSRPRFERKKFETAYQLDDNAPELILRLRLQIEKQIDEALLRQTEQAASRAREESALGFAFRTVFGPDA